MSLSMNAVNQLKSELLLAKGGGIYYDAMRSEADDKTASLFVGLGGTGADMLIRIKNEVMHQMVLPQVNGRIVGDTPNNIGFLAFDTDPETKFKTWGAASFDKFSSEFCSLAVDNISTVIASRKNLAENDDPVWRWYDKIDPIAGNAGSGGLRQIGRLMMIENISKIYTIIQDKIKKMVEVNEGIFSVNVAVVTGISGGTGSGIFIDMAYLLRTVLKDLNIKRNRIFGYIVLPDVNLLKGGQPNMLWANGFAFLKELNYWMSQGSDGRSNKFVQNYGNGVEANITSRVCSYCFLLSSQDLNDKSLTYDKVISSMAENVFTYIAGGECGEQTIGNSSRARLLDTITTGSRS
ncbi:MAG: hypothetical protein GX115_10235 [Ruminiclostridium sp.]|nr:hypothetical protein [Ruminiclostridium sp.]